MKDLTKLTEVFCLLDDETREALVAHGGPYEYLSVQGKWFYSTSASNGGFVPGFVYRVKHVPVERWHNFYPSGRTSIGFLTEAEALANRGVDCIRTILMREVME
jgi:hypothetical protein